MSTKQARPGVTAKTSLENSLGAGLEDNATAPPDTASLNPCCLDYYISGILYGREQGIVEGRAMADAEAAARHHRAWLVVQAMASLPTHAELETRRRTYMPSSAGAA